MQFHKAKRKTFVILAICTITLSACGLPHFEPTTEERSFFSQRTIKARKTIDFPLDASVLEDFSGDNRRVLERYLASDALWSLTRQSISKNGLINCTTTWWPGRWKNGTVAYLRITPSFYEKDGQEYKQKMVSEWLEPFKYKKERHYTNTGYNNMSDTLDDKQRAIACLRVMLEIRGNDPQLKLPGNAKNKIAKIQIFPNNPNRDGNLSTGVDSQLEIRTSDIALIIDETTQSGDPTQTMRAAVFVLDELKQIASAMKTHKEPEPSLLANQSVKFLSADEINGNTGYINPGKPGLLWFHVFPGAYASSHAGDDESQTSAVCAWSKNPGERFFYHIPYSYNDADGSCGNDDFNFELRFQPADRSEEKVLYSKKAKS